MHVRYVALCQNLSIVYCNLLVYNIFIFSLSNLNEVERKRNEKKNSLMRMEISWYHVISENEMKRQKATNGMSIQKLWKWQNGLV